MKYKFTIWVLCCLASLKVFAQQDPIISQYYFNPMFINPAYAGSKESVSAILIYRNQWVGIDGAPVTQTFSIQGPNKKKNMGFGLQIFNDIVGPIRNTGVIFTYAYRVPLGRGKLAFGIQPSLSQYGINWDKIKTQDQIDPAFLQNNDFKLSPDADFGVYYSSNKYFGGFSMSHMIQNSLFAKGNAHAYRHMYFLAGGVIKINKSINLRPSALVRYVEGAAIRTELNIAALFLDKFWLGIGLKRDGSFSNSNAGNQFSAVVEYNLTDKLRFGYSYDIDLQNFGRYNSGSHEIMLAYSFSMYKSKMLVPRYF